MREPIGQLKKAEVATPESCAQLIVKLRDEGSPTVADYLEGKAVYDPDYIAELNALSPIVRHQVDACVHYRAEELLYAKAAELTPEQRAAIAAYEQEQLAAHAAGKPGHTGYVGPGEGISKAGQQAAYGQIKAEIDRQDDPLQFLKGDASLFGLQVPRWALWTAGGLLAFWAVNKLADPRGWRK